MRKPPELADFGQVCRPDEAVQPILARSVRDALSDWLEEIWAEPELQEVGLKPRRRALFDGPPGVGKTTLAHHLAARLGLPMLVVRSERIIDSWLGSTGRNIGKLFDAAAQAEAVGEPVLLFFDELDALAVKRRDTGQSAGDERNASVNVLLAQIEAHQGYMVAATNRGSEIDPAVWRRFDIHVTLELPGAEERRRILARYLAPFALPPRALGLLAEAFETGSPALMRQWCEGLKRALVVGPKVGWDMAREATIGRLIASVGPHPDLGKPRLWSLGPADPAVRAMPWPLPRGEAEAALAAEAEAQTEEMAGERGAVVPLRPATASGG